MGVNEDTERGELPPGIAVCPACNGDGRQLASSRAQGKGEMPTEPCDFCIDTGIDFATTLIEVVKRLDALEEPVPSGDGLSLQCRACGGTGTVDFKTSQKQAAVDLVPLPKHIDMEKIITCPNCAKYTGTIPFRCPSCGVRVMWS